MLLLCDDRKGHADNVYDSIDALNATRHITYKINPRGISMPGSLKLEDFDAVVIHWTLLAISDHYLGPDWREAIRVFNGVKIQLIQDDYRWIYRSAEMMRHMGIQVLYTVVHTTNLDRVWEPSVLPNVEKRSYLTGYVPNRLVNLRTKSTAERTIDVGYRGRKVPYWLGKLGQEKLRIGQEFLSRASGLDLRCDIAWDENSRIYGDKWTAFLGSCRACLGTESGSSIIDFDSSIQIGVDAYLQEHPQASFEEVYEQLLKDRDGKLVHSVISPRVFEAASLRTALIMHPGPYNGIVEPWQHYIPLEKDFSNFDEVVRLVRDDDFITKLTARAYDDLIASRRYAFETHTADYTSTLDRLFLTHTAAPNRVSNAVFAYRWRTKSLSRLLHKYRAHAKGYASRAAAKAVRILTPIYESVIAMPANVSNYVRTQIRRATKTMYRVCAATPWLLIRDHIPTSLRSKLRRLRDDIRRRPSPPIPDDSENTRRIAA